MRIDKRVVVDSLRPDTQTIWLGLVEDEKRRFLRHLFRYWDIIRSRIPPESKAIIDAMRASGQLDVFAGLWRWNIARPNCGPDQVERGRLVQRRNPIVYFLQSRIDILVNGVEIFVDRTVVFIGL
jgi:hypothetical protein